MAGAKGKTVVYIELLRIMAATAVIMIHIIAGLITNYDIGSVNWNICVIIGSLIRWCIPLFFMISGLCFLDREQPISQETILKKYILRLVAVAIAWGAFFYFFELWIYNHPVTVKNLLLAPLMILSGNAGYHLWYLYAIIPIYFLIPALKVYVDNATRVQQKYLLIILFTLSSCFSLFNSVVRQIPQLKAAISIGIVLPEMFAYLACVLSGYYMAHFDLDRGERKVLHLVAVISVLCMPVVNIYVSLLNNSFIITMSEYSGICSISIAGCLLTRLKQLEDGLQKRRIKNTVLSIGGKTFGIYLVHVVFVSILFHKLTIAWGELNALTVIFGSTIAVFIISYIIAWLFAKIPFIKRLV